MKIKVIFFVLIGFILATPVSISAQEFNCKVTVLHDKITGVDNEVFNGMQRSIIDLMNSRKWTGDDYAIAERIDCNMLLNITASKVGGEQDVYSATLSIQASRPVYNSGYNSPIINHVDKDVVFKFAPFNTLQFDDNRVTGSDPLQSNLSAILGYYAYVILAMVNNAPEQGKTIAGWKPTESNRNRYWLTDQLLNARFHDVRSFWYSMHREGLDSMWTKPIVARNRIVTDIKKLYQVNRENPSSMLMQFIFSAKSDEFINMLSQMTKMERTPIATMLSVIDVPNATKYNNLK